MSSCVHVIRGKKAKQKVHLLERLVSLLEPAAHAVPAIETEKVDEDDLSRRLAELKAKG